MDYKVVFSDIDGTLLNDEKKLLPSTAKTIRDLVNAGILFATVSARTIPYTESGISGLKEVCCANAYVNGAFVAISDGEILVDSPMEDAEVSILIAQLNQVQASFAFISKNDAIARILHPGSADGFKLHHGTVTEKQIVDSSELKPHLFIIFLVSSILLSVLFTLDGFTIEFESELESDSFTFSGALSFILG